MPDDTKKLREEIEKEIHSSERFGINYEALGDLLLDNDRTIIAALRAVEALPKTADGVPVVPGMQLFAGDSARCWAGSMPEEDELNLFSRWHQWYSTREAAIAAQQTTKGSAGANEVARALKKSGSGQV